MEVIKCLMCGGELELTENASIAKCKYCGSMQTLPREKSEIRVNAYNRAGHLFMNGDFDKALSLYEKILIEDPEDANAYWSCILCKYGVSYVEDPVTHERKVTVNRTQNTAVVADDLYKSALKYATPEQRELFEREASEIDEIQKGILTISQNEEPFDVFISYKETDERGERTMDSVLATDLYYGLKDAGYRVFLSRITLEDKLGREYEPYIYAALNSAKVMIVIGTRAEYFNAPWVKNEWSRYLKIIKGDRKKMLIPAYRDMDAYDLPEEFALLQAQDMSKIGFLQDIIRGVKKVISKKKEPNKLAQDDEMKAMLEKLVKEKENAPKEKVVERVVQNKSNDGSNAKVGALIRRAELFLEDDDFDSADEYADKVLDIEPECAEAYLVKLLAELELNKRTDLNNYEDLSYTGSANYKKILRFGDDKLKAEMDGYIKNVKYEDILIDIKDMGTDKDIYNDIVTRLRALGDYKDCPKLLKSIPEHFKLNMRNELAKDINNMGVDENCYNDIVNRLESLGNYRDCPDLLKSMPVRFLHNIYDQAVTELETGTVDEIKKAIEHFKKIPNYRDAKEKLKMCEDKLKYVIYDEKLQNLIGEKKSLEESKVDRKHTYYRKKGELAVAILIPVLYLIGISLTITFFSLLIMEKMDYMVGFFSFSGSAILLIVMMYVLYQNLCAEELMLHICTLGLILFLWFIVEKSSALNDVRLSRKSIAIVNKSIKNTDNRIVEVSNELEIYKKEHPELL